MKASPILLTLLIASGTRAQDYRATVLKPPPGFAWAIGAGAGEGSFAVLGALSGHDYPGGCRVLISDGQKFRNVTPPDTVGALINDSAGDQHVGGATTPTGGYPSQAYLWQDSMPINVHPPGFDVSELLGVGGGRQVGYAFRDFFCSECGRLVQRHAGLWQGSAASFTLLHSPAHDFNIALGTDGTQHVGQGAADTGAFHALLWDRSTTTAIDLHPSPDYDNSSAVDTSAGEQVGTVDAGYVHAALWRGSAASFVDLNPPGFVQTAARATRNGVQVGSGSLSRDPGRYRALAWHGSPESVLDLHALLPAEFQSWDSGAEDVDAQGNIVGFVQLADLSLPVIWRVMAAAGRGR